MTPDPREIYDAQFGTIGPDGTFEAQDPDAFFAPMVALQQRAERISDTVTAELGLTRDQIRQTGLVQVMPSEALLWRLDPEGIESRPLPKDASDATLRAALTRLLRAAGRVPRLGQR